MCWEQNIGSVSYDMYLLQKLFVLSMAPGTVLSIFALFELTSHYAKHTLSAAVQIGQRDFAAHRLWARQALQLLKAAYRAYEIKASCRSEWTFERKYLH